MSFADFIADAETVSASFVNPKGGTPVQDPDTMQITYPPADPVVLTAVLLDITYSEQVDRSQLQDNSTNKLIIEDTTANRTINHTWTVTIDGIKYNITGKPKHPRLGTGIITVPLLKSLIV